MSDTYEETPEEPEQPDEDLKDLRAAAKRSKANAEEAAFAKRENAFLKAHVDTDSPLGRLAMAGYQGELDSAQIQEFMVSLGAGTAPVEVQPEISDEEKQATQIRQQVGVGAGQATNEPPPTMSPTQAGLEAFREARGEGRTAEEASAYYFDHVFTAAAKGDDRVLIPQSHNF